MKQKLFNFLMKMEFIINMFLILDILIQSQFHTNLMYGILVYYV